MSTRNFLDSLNQAIFTGMILVGRLVAHHARTTDAPTKCQHKHAPKRFAYIYVLRTTCKNIEIIMMTIIITMIIIILHATPPRAAHDNHSSSSPLAACVERAQVARHGFG